MYGGESVLLFKNEFTNRERGIEMNLMVEGKITTIGDMLGILLICVFYSIISKIWNTNIQKVVLFWCLLLENITESSETYFLHKIAGIVPMPHPSFNTYEAECFFFHYRNKNGVKNSIS